MLAADKLQLQSALKQQATALKEKEFNLHHSNLMTVGTQAAVLAALNVTMFIEFQPNSFMIDNDGDDVGPYIEMLSLFQRTVKFIYYISICTAMMSNILVVSHTTVLAVLGTSLALRGPDGSMIVATEGLYSERSLIFKTFGRGLICTVFSCAFAVFLILHWEASCICFTICMLTIREIINFYKRVLLNFDFDENNEAIDLTDIFNGPANIVGRTSEQFNRAILRANNIRDEGRKRDGKNENGRGNRFDRDLETGSLIV